MKKEFLKLEPAEGGPVTYFPAPASVLHRMDLFEKRVLLPFLTVPGELIDAQYEGLKFHLVAHPPGLSQLDFKFAPDGSYELLAVDEEDVLDANNYDTFLEGQEGEDEHFDDFPEEPEPMEVKSIKDHASGSGCVIERGFPTWAQSTYEDWDIDEEDGVDTTDYGNPLLQDDEGDPLQFVMASYAMTDVFGYYYLFYSPNTGLVRQFFQCT